VFNGRGQPSHLRGVTPVGGAYFVGLPWLYTWGSGRFSGVARDAEYLVGHIRSRIGDSQSMGRQSGHKWDSAPSRISLVLSVPLFCNC
jgi:putative flavoprotein involved in K+ transport